MINRELTTGEYMEMLIGHGELDGSVFETPFVKRAAWNLHREELLDACTEGTRPDAFWQFEHPDMQDASPEDQRAYLRRLKLLSREEEAKLAAWEAIKNTEVNHENRNATPAE